MSAALVAANDDLLTEILLRLPVKPLFSSKCVSKHWDSLISNPYFCHRKSRGFCNKTTDCLLVHQFKMSSSVPEYDVVPLDEIGASPGDSIVASLNSGVDKPMKILQSCNGLLCCRTGGELVGRYDYYICNPTTRQFRKLPDPIHRDFSMKNNWWDSVFFVQLAFEPRKSPHFKVVCLYFSKEEGDNLEMEIYSSQTGHWRHQACGDHLKIEVPFEEYEQWIYADRQNAVDNFRYGAVYWNGSINWLNHFMGDGLYFDVEEERFGKIPMLPIPNGSRKLNITYIGESYDHFILIESYDPMVTQFDVYEMDREYSGWSLKDHIDIKVIINSSLYSMHTIQFGILSFAWDRNDEISFVVLCLDGQAIRYHPGNKSFFKIWEFSTSDDLFDLPFNFRWIDTFRYIESIYSV